MDRFTILPTDRPTIMSPRERQIKYAWDAYEGNLVPPLKQRRGQPDDNVMVNTSRVIVDKGVSFLFGKGVTWNLDSDETRSSDEKYLDDTWDFNNKDQLLHQLAINGGVTGHAFLKMRIDQPYVRLSVLDSSKVEVKSAENDYTDVLAYVVRWEGRVDPQTGKQKHYRQIIQKMRATTEVMDDSSLVDIPQTWMIIDQWTESNLFATKDEVWHTIMTEEWPFPFAPIIDCQNMPRANEYWGMSDLEKDIIGLNEDINRALSNINRIIRLHAHPKTWSRGLTEQQIHQLVIDPDGVVHLPGEMGSLHNLEMNSDLSSSLNYYKELKAALYEISRVPKIAFGNEENVNYLAAVAMQVLYGPLIEKTEVKHKTYGYLIKETNRRILSVSGRGDTSMVDLVWPNMLPRDIMLEAQVALMKQQAGVSVDTTLEELGHNPVYEKSRRQADLAEQVTKSGLLAKATAVDRPEDRPQERTNDRPA